MGASEITADISPRVKNPLGLGDVGTSVVQRFRGIYI